MLDLHSAEYRGTFLRLFIIFIICTVEGKVDLIHECRVGEIDFFGCGGGFDGEDVGVKVNVVSVDEEEGLIACSDEFVQILGFVLYMLFVDFIFDFFD